MVKIIIKMGIFQKSKYIFQENNRLVMYDIDIKDALYYSDMRGILEILGKMVCFTDSK